MAHLPTFATLAALGTISRSSGITRFVQGGVVKPYRCATYRMADPRRLVMPPELDGDEAAYELVSAWASSSRVKIMTRSGTGLDNNPAIWGEILAGIAANIAVCIQDKNGAEPSETLAAIKSLLDAKWRQERLPDGEHYDPT